MPVWSFCCMIRNIHSSNKYKELVGDQILGVTLHNDPIFEKNKKIWDFSLLSSVNARILNLRCVKQKMSCRRKDSIKGHVFYSYRRTNRDKLFEGLLAEEKGGEFYLKII